MDSKSDIECKYLKEFKLGNTQLTYTDWLKKKIKIYTEELDKQSLANGEEKQEFQLGDTAYMLDDDYKFFESIVKRIELTKGKYYYETSDVDFKAKDINEWVFKSAENRLIYLASKLLDSTT